MRLPALLGLSLLAIAPTARAERQLFGRPVRVLEAPTAEELARRRVALQEHLEANDLVLDGDRIVPRLDLMGPSRPSFGGAAWEEPPHYATIYLNFMGGMLSSGTNAAAMESGCVGAMPIEYPAFDGSESFALTVIQVFENAMAPYAVRIAHEDAPPSHLPYSMVMMGGSPQDVGMGAGILGVSCSTDCGDVWWRDTTFAFTEQSSSSLTLGNTALQEAAHAFGLDHIAGNGHIMYPFASSGEKSWASECTAYDDATGGISCTYVHDVFCGEDAGMQNDDAELLAYFGPNEPDISPPTVTITEPADGAVYPGPVGIAVAAEVDDDHEGFGWRLVVKPECGDAATRDAVYFETSWNVDLPEGTYTIRVEAIDHDRNTGEDAVTIRVGEPMATDTGCDESSTSSGSSTTDAGSSGSEGAHVDEDPNPGCDCIAGSRPLPAIAGVLALVLGIRRRGARGCRLP